MEDQLAWSREARGGGRRRTSIDRDELTVQEGAARELLNTRDAMRRDDIACVRE